MRVKPKHQRLILIVAAGRAPGGDPMLDTASVVAGSCVCALVVLPWVPLPDPTAWKFVAASATRQRTCSSR